MPDHVIRGLVGIGGQWHAVYSGAVAYAQADGVRVADGEIFDGNRQLAGVTIGRIRPVYALLPLARLTERRAFLVWRRGGKTPGRADPLTAAPVD